MSNVTTNTVLGLVVGSAAQAGSVAATPNLLGPGQVGAYKESGTLADGTETAFFIARGGETPGKFMRTSVIDMSSKGAYAALKTGAAAVGQVDYIGFNGTSGSIETIADNMYYVRLYMQELLGSASDARQIKHGVYNSGSVATQIAIAEGISASINLNLSTEPEQKIHASVVNSAAASNESLASVVMTYGSDIVNHTDPTLDLAVGDYIRIGGETAGFSVTRVIEAVSPTVSKVATKWYGPTQDTVGGTVIIASQGSDYGIKLHGQELDWRRGRIFDSVTMWDTVITDFGSTEVTKATGASKGTFTGREVSDLETFAQGYYGEEYRIGEPNLFPADAVANANSIYNGFRFHTVNDEVVGIGATPTSKKEYLCVLPNTETGSAIYTLLTALLT